MTLQHFSFGSIEQFRNTVKCVRDRASFHQVPVPKLNFHGTVKLHGTNASVVFNRDGSEFYAQSRSNIITPEDDNAGFARFAHERKAELAAIFKKAAMVREHYLWSHMIIYGEWCGGNIQKGVALNQIPKMFVIFHVRLYLADEHSYWFTPSEVKSLGDAEASMIKNIENFQCWDVEVDFNKPEIAQNTFVDLTMAVEAECPFGKAHGVSGVGEGIVWVCTSPEINTPTGVFKTSDLNFKTKGEKHSDTKVKVIVQVDAEKVENIRTLVENVLTDHRLDKMFDKVREQGLDPLDIKNTGVFLKLVGQDVEREERDTLEASGFEWKDVAGPLNRAAREWFMNKIKQF